MNGAVSRFSVNGRAFRWFAAGALLAIFATMAITAGAHPGRGGDGPGFGGAGFMMGPGGHMGRGLDRMLDSVNASDAQRTQIKQITAQAATDLKGQRDEGRKLRDQAMSIFTAPAVDAGAAESVRQQMLAQHDASSRRMLQAMIDIANVLTPEQRATLGQQIQARRQRMQEHWQQRHSQQPKQ